MRTYICTGLGKTYTIEANSPASAKLKAARALREEAEDFPLPIDFYAQYFEPRVIDPQKPGRRLLI